MSASSQYYSVTARVGVPHRHEVEVTIPLVGPAGATGPAGAAGASAWDDITGKPSTFAPSAHASSHATGGSDPLTPANIGAAKDFTEIEVGNTGTSTTTLTTAQLPARVILFIDAATAPSATINLPTPDARQSGLVASIKVQVEGGTADTVLITVVHNAANLLSAYSLAEDEGSIDFRWDGYRWVYDANWLLRSSTGRVLELPTTSGTLARTQDFAAPPAIGNTTPAAGSFTTLNATGTTELVNGGTTAGPFRIYNTSSSANANYERLFIKGNTGGAFQIGTERGGSGGQRNLEFNIDGNATLTLFTSAAMLASTASLWVNQRLIMDSEADGNLRLRNWSGTGFGLLRLGGSTNLFPALKRSSTTLQVRLANDSDFAPFECAGLTLNGNLTASTRNIVTDTTTGTKIGTSTTQKIGFFDKTPVVQPTAVADATDAATVITQLNALLSRMRDLGLIAT